MVIPESEFEHILPQGFEFPILSTLVEELLHIRLYIAAWKHGKRREKTWWEDGLYNFCCLFHDEYIVGRMKVPMLASLFPTSESNGGDEFSIFYPNPLAPLLDQGVTKINQLMSDFQGEVISLDDFWNGLINILYRYFFEPLARDAAFRDANSTESPIKHNAHEVSFYIKIFKPTWEAVYKELDLSFQSNLLVANESLERMIKLMVQFLANLGVTFQQVESGDWWLFVDTGVFREITNKLAQT